MAFGAGGVVAAGKNQACKLVGGSMEKSIVFIGRKCEAGEGTGIVGSVEERDVTELRPDGVSKALNRYLRARGIGFRALGEALGVSATRASELCRGAGAEMSDQERFSIAQLLGGPTYEMLESITESFAEIGDGDIIGGFRLVNAISERLRHARRKHEVFAEGAPHALGVIHAEYRELEQAVEHGEGREREQDESLDVIATAARFWLGEHVRNS